MATNVATDSYPSKPLTIIVPQSSGSLIDRLTRLLAPEISRLMGQPVTIENRPGNQGLLGSKYVATQAPVDGYTALITTLTNIASFVMVDKDIGFDPPTDLTPVVCVAEGRIMFGVGSQQSWTTFEELIAFAKAHPGALNYGASSSSNRLKTELIFGTCGAKVGHFLFDDEGAEGRDSSFRWNDKAGG